MAVKVAARRSMRRFSRLSRSGPRSRLPAARSVRGTSGDTREVGRGMGAGLTLVAGKVCGEGQPKDLIIVVGSGGSS